MTKHSDHAVLYSCSDTLRRRSCSLAKNQSWLLYNLNLYFSYLHFNHTIPVCILGSCSIQMGTHTYPHLCCGVLRLLHILSPISHILSRREQVNQSLKYYILLYNIDLSALKKTKQQPIANSYSSS